MNLIFDNIYEILLGAGIVLSTIFNRPKTAEKLKKIRQKSLERKEKKLSKVINEGKKLASEIDELKKEE